MVTTGAKPKKQSWISAVNIYFLYFSIFYSSAKGSRSFPEGSVLLQLKLSRICLKNQLIWEARRVFLQSSNILVFFQEQSSFWVWPERLMVFIAIESDGFKTERGTWGINWSLSKWYRSCLRPQNLSLVFLLPYDDWVNVDNGLKKV